MLTSIISGQHISNTHKTSYLKINVGKKIQTYSSLNIDFDFEYAIFNTPMYFSNYWMWFCHSLYNIIMLSTFVILYGGTKK